MNPFTKIFAGLILISLSILSLSCAEKEARLKDNFSFESLSFTTQCGWCIPTRQITITKKKRVKFSLEDSCEDFEINKERALTSEEIDAINTALDVETLLDIDFDQCGICIDACDDGIKIEESSGEGHSIRYTSSKNVKLEEIQELITILEEIRDGF